MKPRDTLVAAHGHCFDGMASSALFTRLVRSLEPASPLAFRYKSCGYGPGMQQVPEAWLDGDENAILDFRYTPSRKLTWYFDHHITGFASPAERDAALAAAAEPAPGEAAGPVTVGSPVGGPVTAGSPVGGPVTVGSPVGGPVTAGSPVGGPGTAGSPVGGPSRPHVHYDPTYGSCAKLIADVARDRYGVDMSPLEELIGWADTIDAARFASAEAATSRDEPVLQLAAVVEHHGDGPFLNAMVPKLLEKPLLEIARSDEIQQKWQPIGAARETFRRRVERAARVMGRVVMVDLTDAPVDVAAKFVTYSLFPGCVYSVNLSRNKQHYKLSVGYNPWSGEPRTHDIAAICRRYDGGGHPAVGACSFPLSARDRAKEVAEVVAQELSQ